MSVQPPKDETIEIDALHNPEARDDIKQTKDVLVGGDSPPKKSSDEVRDPKYDSEPEEAAGMGNFWRILSYGSKLDYFLMAVATACSAGAGVALPLMNVVFGSLVGDFNDYFTPGKGVTKERFLAAVSQNALYIVYLFIGKFCLSYLSMFSYRMTGIRISAALRLAYLKALFAQPVSVLDKQPQGRATNLITTSANTIQLAISEKLATFIQACALVISAYVIAFKYSWQLTLVSSSAMLFILLVYGFLIPIMIKIFHTIEHADDKAASIAAEVFGAIRTVMALGAEHQMTKKYVGWVTEAKRRGLKLNILVGIQFAPTFFAMYCNFALSFWYGIQLVNQNNGITVTNVVVVFFSILIVVVMLGQIAVPLIAIAKAASAAAGIFTIIDTPRPNEGGLKEPEVSSQEDITFENVTFAYPSRPSTKILDEMNATFEVGRTTAIVGPSGSGKSTIVGLLERWYQLTDVNAPYVEKEDPDDKSKYDPVKKMEKDKAKKAAEEAKKEKKKADKVAKKAKKHNKGGDNPEPAPTVESTQNDDGIVQNSGAIRIGKHDITTLDARWWRSQIGLVQQEPFLFNSSIFQNVAHGLIGSKWENEDNATKRTLVEEACKEAFADEFIKRLPQGYDTKVGEGGIKLSGGQRQRLAIARSIIKRPTILVLDEATSSIDVRGERIVQAALDQVSKNRTTITIAHRLSTIKKADRIVVLKQGVCVEQGTHDTLLAKDGGVYRNLVLAQHLDIGAEEEDDDLAFDDSLDDVEEVELVKTKSQGSKKGDGTEEDADKKAQKAKGIIGTVGRFLYEQRNHKWLYTTILLSAAGCGAAYPIQSYLTAHLFETFQYTGQKLLDQGNFWALMFFILAIFNGLCYFLIGYAANAVAVYVSAKYREQYFESILWKPILFYDDDKNSTGSLNSRLSNDIKQLQELLGPNMAFPAIAVFNVVGCVIIAFYFGWKLTLVTLCSSFPFILVASLLRLRFEIQFEELNAKVFAESSQFAGESIKAFRTVTSLTLEHTITDRYSVLLNEHISKAFRKAFLATLIFAGSDSVELACMAFTFWYGGQLLGNLEYTPTQFFVIYVAIIQGSQAAGQFLSFAPNMAQATAAGNRILEFRLSAQALMDKEGRATPPPREVGGADIELKNVYFKYPARDTPVFEDVSLSIGKGQFVAFVGPSGCGKTTIISLLERFYEINKGAITMNGASIQGFEPSVYRKSLALVSQEPTLFEGTIRDNLVLGYEGPELTDEAIEAACKAASIHDFITSLPQSYGTELGTSSNSSLSGGQKQRLCIARALLRKPTVLLLDEATSSLDSQSEKLVQESLENVAGKRDMTVVVVAHRLATIQKADTIFVFGEGRIGRGARIVEKGTHKELVAKKGVYYGMCQAQALDR